MESGLFSPTTPEHGTSHGVWLIDPISLPLKKTDLPYLSAIHFKQRLG